MQVRRAGDRRLAVGVKDIRRRHIGPRSQYHVGQGKVAEIVGLRATNRASPDRYPTEPSIVDQAFSLGPRAHVPVSHVGHVLLEECIVVSDHIRVRVLDDQRIGDDVPAKSVRRYRPAHRQNQTAFAYRSRVVQDVDSVRRRIPSVGPSSAIAIILLSTNVLTENPFVALIVVRRWIDEHIAKLGSRR